MTFRPMILISALLLGACSQNEQTLNAIESSQLSNADDSHRQDSLPVLEPLVLAKWQTSCALCHIDGNGGAPKIGFEEDWSEQHYFESIKPYNRGHKLDQEKNYIESLKKENIINVY